MLIAEDLLLLLTDDVSGAKQADSTKFSYSLAGAVLLELSLQGRVDVASTDDTVKKGRVIIRSADPTDDEVLDHGLAVLTKYQGRKPRDVIAKLAKGLSDQLYARLERREILSRQPSKVMGVVSRLRWPAVDSSHKQELTRKITAAIAEPGTDPEPQIGALISLLTAIDKIVIVVHPEELGLSKRETKKRAKQIADRSWAPEAVRQAVEAVNAAVMAGVMAATVAAAAGAS